MENINCTLQLVPVTKWEKDKQIICLEGNNYRVETFGKLSNSNPEYETLMKALEKIILDGCRGHKISLALRVEGNDEISENYEEMDLNALIKFCGNGSTYSPKDELVKKAKKKAEGIKK